MSVASEPLPSIVEGDDIPVSLSFTDDTGTPLDITGWTVWLTIKERASDSNPLIGLSTTTHDDPTNGQTSFTLTNTQTAGLIGQMVYDIQVKDNVGQITTILRGRVRFIDGVTDDT